MSADFEDGQRFAVSNQAIECLAVSGIDAASEQGQFQGIEPSDVL
jgi:hypothetical protein